MTKTELGIYDVIDRHQMADFPLAADVYDEHIRGAQEAEQMGYKYYFSIEHQTSTVSYMSAPNIYLTALARATSTIRVGMMIYQLPFHHPIRLAEDTAMLDHLSRGRLEFGAGTGVTPHEFLRWNVDFDRRRDISEEAMEIILQAWTKDEVTFQGEFFQFDEVLTTPKPYQQPHPPIWFGAHSAASFEYAARMNFDVSQNIDIDTTVAQKFQTWRQLWDQCGHTGPKPRAFLTRHVHVAETDAKAREEAEPHLLMARSGSRPSDNGELDLIGQTRIGYGTGGRYTGVAGTPEREELRRVFQEQAKSYDFWIDNGLALVGNPDTVARKIEEQQKLVGHDILCARQRFGKMSPEVAKKSIKLFAEEVIPAFS